MASQPAIHIHRSNRTEALAEALCQLVAEPLGDPFEPEVVVVQGRGMATWLSMELARRHGVSANTEFVYPRSFVQRALQAMLGQEAVPDEALSEDRLLWAVQAELPALLGDASFERLRRYVSDDPKGLKRHQLADRIATLFDQYLVYRPAMIRAWEQGDDGEVPAAQQWQPRLWRAVTHRFAGRHAAALEEAFLTEAKKRNALSGLPKRLALFGVSSLPPLFVRVFGALAPQIETHLFLLSPSPQDWWTRDQADPGTGTSLVTTLGALGADFHHLLHAELDDLGVAVQPHLLFVPPPGDGLLGQLHSEIYELAPDPTASGADGARPRSDVADQSITIHACHGPMREVEVLHDQLLDLLTREGSELKPHQIVVMMPDVETYAPLVEAVFEREIGTEHYIPYRISDRSVRTDSPVIEAFVRLLELSGSRLPASQVLDLLTQPAIQGRFGFAPGDVEQLTRWVVDSGIRWGIDGDDRSRHDQPEVHQNTWRFGLDRLLLGYGMPTEGLRTFAGVLPYDQLEGTQAELLGCLAELCETLFEQLAKLADARPLSAWTVTLGELLDAMVLQDSDTAWEHEKIRHGLELLATAAAEAGFDEPVDLAVVRSLLERNLDTAHPERGFMTNGVTVCAMVPMRSIPFQVVCLLGMNDGAFPRSGRPVDFDLIAHGPQGLRPGDRDRRKDDRYIFLEALMAARERLVVTYTGQSIRDNSERPPSVSVSELLDTLCARWDPAESFDGEKERLAALHRQWVVRHPLQGFSPRYFDGSDSRLFSYAEMYRYGAEQLTPERHAVGPFFEQVLSSEPSPDRAVPIGELVRFIQDPVAYLMSRRLALHLDIDDLEVADREPVELGFGEQHQLGAAMLSHKLRGVADERSRELARASGGLPFGTLGSCSYADLSEPVDQIAAAVAEWRNDDPQPALAVDARLPSGLRLTGEIGGLWGQGLLHHQFSRVRANRMLGFWVRHLVVCWLGGNDQPKRARLIGRAERGPGCRIVTWGKVDDAAQRLTELCNLYQAGQSAPLRFAPRASLAYAAQIGKGKRPDQALSAARQEYSGRAGYCERSFSPHLVRVFGDHDPPFDQIVTVPPPLDQFAELALAVFAPMLAAEEAE